MYPLFETILIKDGEPQNLSSHLNRIHRSQRDYLHLNLLLSEAEFLSIIEKAAEQCSFSDSLLKLKFYYNTDPGPVEIIPYERRKIKSLKLVHDNTIEYSFKLSDRSAIDRLIAQKGDADDIIIVKNGFITDSSFGNLVFENDEGFFTPESALLKGTRRQSLLDTLSVTEVSIKTEDLHKYKYIHNINAMNTLGDQVIKVSDIL
jgi:4-amino-4-deoxychorismate lyase